MSEYNDSSITDMESTPEDSDRGEDILRFIRSVDLLGLTSNVRGGSHFDNKAYRDQVRAKREAIRYISNAKERAYAFWQVFEAVYETKVERDAWAGTYYYLGKATTTSKLVAKLEKVLEMSRPKASEGFYDRQLDQMMEYWEFQPVRRYLEKTYEDLTRTLDRSSRSWVTKELELLPEWDNLGEVLFGDKDPLTQEMITTWLVGAVKRVMEPGCYQKRALILKGDQDAGKSAFVSELARSWATELPSGTSDMDFIRLCTRTWIMELPECDRLFKGKEASILKQQLSTRVDKYIPKYKEAEGMIETPRVTVFIGTTNKAQFLVDDTGNNRFWVIDIPSGWKLPLDWLKANVDQLWATAYQKLMFEGHSTDLSESSRVAAETRNHNYMVEGSWVEQIESVLADVTRDGERDIAFKLGDLLSAMGVKPENHSRHKAAVVSSLKQLGYKNDTRTVLGKSVRLYFLKTAKKPIAARFWNERWELMATKADADIPI
ncbi:MAG: VapE domain-containing protein [Cyanobacteriota bacterium]